jgi:hypothetical protein
VRLRRLIPIVVVPLACLACLVSVAACKHDADQEHAHEHPREWNLPPVGASVKVALDGKSADVTLASLQADGGPRTVSFVELWKSAWPSEDPAPLRFDFVGSDGFRPTSKPKCARLLTGRELAAARLDVATHDLLLEDAAKLPGCYRVRAVVAIEATR